MFEIETLISDLQCWDMCCIQGYKIQPQTPTHTHLVQLLYPPDQQWVTGRVLKINIICRGTARRRRRNRKKQSGEWKEKDKEVSVSNVRSVKRSGQFPIGPHNDSLISQEESAAETYTKCWFNSIRLISYTAVAVVVGKSDRMRCWRANAHSHINNKTGSPTLPFK